MVRSNVLVVIWWMTAGNVSDCWIFKRINRCLQVTQKIISSIVTFIWPVTANWDMSRYHRIVKMEGPFSFHYKIRKQRVTWHTRSPTSCSWQPGSQHPGEPVVTLWCVLWSPAGLRESVEGITLPRHRPPRLHLLDVSGCQAYICSSALWCQLFFWSPSPEVCVICAAIEFYYPSRFPFRFSVNSV